MVGWSQVARDGAEQLEAGQSTRARGAHEIAVAEAAPAETCVTADQIARSGVPQASQGRKGDRHPDQPPEIAAAPAEILEGIERDRAVLDLFGAVPAEQIEHHRVGAPGLERS